MNNEVKKNDFTLDNCSIIEAMRMGVNYVHPAKVRNFSVLLRPLSIQETINVAQEVVKSMSMMSDIEKTRLQEHSLVAIHTLVRASTPSPESGNETAKLSGMILRQLTNDELHALFKEYTIICEKVNPHVENLTQEEIKSLVDDIKKNPSHLIDLSFLQLVNLVKYYMTNVE